MNENRQRVWSFIVWQESAPYNWIQILDDLHIVAAISPLHDKDITEDNEPKKPHWHVILNFSGVKSYDQIKEITDSINAGFPVRVQDIFALTRYLIHLDNPEKAQYDKNEIIALGGYDIDYYFEMPKSKVRLFIKEITEYILQNNITEFCSIIDYSVRNNPDWFYVLSQVSTNYFTSFIKSLRHDHQNKMLQNNYKVDEDGVICG